MARQALALSENDNQTHLDGNLHERSLDPFSGSSHSIIAIEAQEEVAQAVANVQQEAANHQEGMIFGMAGGNCMSVNQALKFDRRMALSFYEKELMREALIAELKNILSIDEENQQWSELVLSHRVSIWTTSPSDGAIEWRM